MEAEIATVAPLLKSLLTTVSSRSLLELSLSYLFERNVRHHSFVRIGGTGRSRERRAEERRNSSLSLSLNFRYL